MLQETSARQLRDTGLRGPGLPGLASLRFGIMSSPGMQCKAEMQCEKSAQAAARRATAVLLVVECAQLYREVPTRAYIMAVNAKAAELGSGHDSKRKRSQQSASVPKAHFKKAKIDSVSYISSKSVQMPHVHTALRNNLVGHQLPTLSAPQV